MLQGLERYGSALATALVVLVAVAALTVMLTAGVLLVPSVTGLRAPEAA